MWYLSDLFCDSASCRYDSKIFDVINSRAARKAEEAKKAAEAVKAVAKPEPIKAAAPVVEDGIEEETVAVIMAAISAMSSAEGARSLLLRVARNCQAPEDLHGPPQA